MAYVCAKRSTLSWGEHSQTALPVHLFSLIYQRETCSSHQLTLAHCYLDRFPKVRFFCNSSTLEGEGSKLQYETGECCLITQ